jgi:hypothetical protein
MRKPASNNGKRGDKRSGNAHSKSPPLPVLIFTLFRTLAMACVNFTITTPIRLTGVFHPVLGQKTILPLNHFQFGGKKEGVFAYIDDSRVGSLDRQTHLRHLEAFFIALVTSGLAINLEKCIFTAPCLEILGHMISATGAAPTAGHVAEIENCPPPQDIKQLQHFLGISCPKC